jgi:WhiB family redox-sensing transcriptional regulator
MTTPTTRRGSIRGVPRITPRPGLTQPGAWTERALCAQADPDTWFPDEEDPELAAAAIRVCARCPVRGDCLAHALAIGERHGIWGGLTARQRQHLRARGEKAA